MRYILGMMLSVGLLVASNRCELELEHPVVAKDRPTICQAVLHMNFIKFVGITAEKHGAEKAIESFGKFSQQDYIQLGKSASQCYDLCITSISKLSL